MISDLDVSGLPSVYEHLWESVPPGYETPREAEPSQILSSPVSNNSGAAYWIFMSYSLSSLQLLGYASKCPKTWISSISAKIC